MQIKMLASQFIDQTYTFNFPGVGTPNEEYLDNLVGGITQANKNSQGTKVKSLAHKPLMMTLDELDPTFGKDTDTPPNSSAKLKVI